MLDYFTRTTAVPRSIALAALLLLICACPGKADEPKPSIERSIRVRVEWGGTTPRSWSGLVELSRGRLEQPVSLGIEADEPGTIWIDRGAVWLQRSSRIYDGFDISVVAPTEAALTFTLQSTDPEPVRKQFNVPIADLLRGDDNVLKQEDESLRVVMRRAPGDLLKVVSQRPHMIFSPGEPFAATVALESATRNDRKTKTELTWQLRPARMPQILSQAMVPVDFGIGDNATASVPIAIPLPHDEGAYDILFSQHENGKETKERVVQVVVLDSARKSIVAGETESTANLVDSFRPGSVNFLRRVAPRASAKALNQAVAGLLSVFPNGRDAKQTTDAENAVKWNAYKLHIRHPERPHRLVVSVNSAKSQNIGISVLEPNAADQLMPVGLDSGLHVVRDRSAASDANSQNIAADAIKHEVIFWPRVSDPVLMLHDMGTDAPAPIDVALVEVYELTSLTAANSAAPVSQDLPRRLTGPCMHKPMLPENFGGQQALDPQSGRSLHDWVTFHQSVLRTAEYLKHFGYNSLLLSVLADGSTIYPSNLLQPTPRYDTGTFFSTGQDPLRKDVLELLLRVFDREGLTLVPELQFSTPLPALERMIAADNTGSRGIELIGADGRSWRESRKTMRGLAPYYNPLDPRVQQAVLDVVNELAARYHSHSSFGGLAVELSGAGYLQLSGLDWGYDDDTVARFSQATGIAVPGGDGNDRFKTRHDCLTSQHEAKWVRWRSEELAKFHRRLADALHAYKPESQFVLACTELFNDANYSTQVAEMLRSGRKPDSLLAEKGINLDLYSSAENFTVLRPAVWQAPAKSLGRTADQTFNDGSLFNSLSSTCRQGSLFFHVPFECRIADFDKVSPWQPAYTWLVTQASMTGIENRKRYADALASGGAQMLFDGGWMIPLGQEQATSRIREMITQLPAVPFHPNKSQRQPITVRLARHQGETWIYAVNQVPFSVGVRLQLKGRSDMTGRVLPDSRPFTASASADGKKVAQFQLEPYDVWACRLSDASVIVESVETDMPAASLTEIAARIKRIDQTIGDMRHVQNANQYLVQNPGFEQQANERANFQGWELQRTTASRWTLDNDNPRSGGSSLLLTSASDDGAALSSTLAVDASMRLFTMSVWLRSDQDAADVRLVFSAEADGKPQVRYLPVTVNTEWKHYEFRVTDIPADQLANAKVRIEIRGPGKLWIDDIDIHQNRLSPEDLRQITKTHSAITVAWNEGRYADCQRLLDSYWGQLLFDESQSNADAKHNAKKTATGLHRLLRQ